MHCFSLRCHAWHTFHGAGRVVCDMCTGGVRLFDLDYLPLKDSEGAVRALLDALKTTPAAMVRGMAVDNCSYRCSSVNVVILSTASCASQRQARS